MMARSVPINAKMMDGRILMMSSPVQVFLIVKSYLLFGIYNIDVKLNAFTNDIHQVVYGTNQA